MNWCSTRSGPFSQILPLTGPAGLSYVQGTNPYSLSCSNVCCIYVNMLPVNLLHLSYSLLTFSLAVQYIPIWTDSHQFLLASAHCPTNLVYPLRYHLEQLTMALLPELYGKGLPKLSRERFLSNCSTIQCTYSVDYNGRQSAIYWARTPNGRPSLLHTDIMTNHESSLWCCAHASLCNNTCGVTCLHSCVYIPGWATKAPTWASWHNRV